MRRCVAIAVVVTGRAAIGAELPVRLLASGTLNDTPENRAFLDGIGATTLDWKIGGTASFLSSSVGYVIDTGSRGGGLGGLDVIDPGSLFGGGTFQIGRGNGLSGQNSDLGAIFQGDGIDFSVLIAVETATGPQLAYFKGIGALPSGTVGAADDGAVITGFDQLSRFEVQSVFGDTLLTGRIDSFSFRTVPTPSAVAVAAIGFALRGRRRSR